MPRTLPANLKPSLLDRLVDVSRHDSAADAWYTPEQVMESVRRDLENLLNTRMSSQGLCDGYEEVTNSLITYGVPDASSLQTITARQRFEIVRELEQTITRFEPRLSSVKVTLAEPATRKDRVLRMQIRATLNVEPALDCELSGALEVGSGHISMAISP